MVVAGHGSWMPGASPANIHLKLPSPDLWNCKVSNIHLKQSCNTAPTTATKQAITDTIDFQEKNIFWGLPNTASSRYFAEMIFGCNIEISKNPKSVEIISPIDFLKLRFVLFRPSFHLTPDFCSSFSNRSNCNAALHWGLKKCVHHCWKWEGGQVKFTNVIVKR